MRPVAQNQPDFNSSQGFKRRLIRPASSRGGERAVQLLRSFDISQNESILASLAKADLAALQEDINSVDIDKRIRTDDISISKGYVTTLKKWLREVQNNQNKEEEDESKILKLLNVDNVTSGFKKLWKITQYLDSLVTKSAELQVITFLKYDQLFATLCGDSFRPVTKKLGMLGQGFPAGSFQTASVFVERLQDLYSLASKTKKSSVQPKQSLGSTINDSQKLVRELQAQNAKLCKFLQEIEAKSKESQKALEQPKPQVQVKLPQSSPIVKVQRTALDVAITQISSSYERQLEDLASKLKKAMDSQAFLRLEVRGYKQQLDAHSKDSKEQKSTVSSGSYEATLKQQLDSMKRGFQSKISKMKEDYMTREKDMMRRENEYRIENEKVKFQRQLLMKKYDLAK